MAENQHKPHAVCVPWPAQGHLNPMLMLAKLLHSNGFHVTFVNTEHNHRRLLSIGGPTALEGLPDFWFAAIPDGLPPSDPRTNLPSRCRSISTTCLEPFCDLLSELQASSSAPPVSCIVSDGLMSFTLQAAERFRLPEVLFLTASACGLLGFTQLRLLVEKGYIPLQDMSQVTNGYLEKIVDWIPGVKNIRLKDIPSFIRITDPNNVLLNYAIHIVEAVHGAKALILNTFDALEQDVLNALLAMFPRVYTLGPLHLMMNHVDDERLKSINFSLWEEDTDCIRWLDSKEPGSVVYVNFGSITVVSVEQLTELAWGLANSKKPFLWIIRADMVQGESAMLPSEFIDQVKERSMLIRWCPQERVLNHPAVGGFLTHSGWNSTLESIAGGVPMICWPFFAEQPTNCRFTCVEWEIGMEINNDVKRDEVEVLVRELMDGKEGKKLKEKAMEWKKKAEEATSLGGSSYLNFDKLIKEELL